MPGRIPGMPKGTYKDVLNEPGYNPTWEAAKRLSSKIGSLEQARRDLEKSVETLRQELQESEQQVGELAFDDITGLLAPNAFSRVMSLMIKEAEESGKILVLFDIDANSTKYFNDHFGHRTGDASLRRVAEPLLTRNPQQPEGEQLHPKHFIGHWFAATKRGEDMHACAIVDDIDEASRLGYELFSSVRDYKFTSPKGEILHGSAAIGASTWDKEKAQMNNHAGLRLLFDEAEARMYAMKHTTGANREQAPVPIREEEGRWIFLDRPQEPSLGGSVPEGEDRSQ